MWNEAKFLRRDDFFGQSSFPYPFYCFDPWFIGGEFNILRWALERFPPERMTEGMHSFNIFIEDAGFWKFLCLMTCSFDLGKWVGWICDEL